MIIVCKQVDERLTRAWYRLQQAVEVKHGHSISQIQADEETVELLEKLADKLEKETKT
jgi:hypothetical protein